MAAALLTLKGTCLTFGCHHGVTWGQEGCDSKYQVFYCVRGHSLAGGGKRSYYVPVLPCSAEMCYLCGQKHTSWRCHGTCAGSLKTLQTMWRSGLNSSVRVLLLEEHSPQTSPGSFSRDPKHYECWQRHTKGRQQRNLKLHKADPKSTKQQTELLIRCSEVCNLFIMTGPGQLFFLSCLKRNKNKRVSSEGKSPCQTVFVETNTLHLNKSLLHNSKQQIKKIIECSLFSNLMQTHSNSFIEIQHCSLHLAWIKQYLLQLVCISVLASYLQSPTVKVNKSDHRRLSVSILHLRAFIQVCVRAVYL